jgi:hypothetical protein
VYAEGPDAVSTTLSCCLSCNYNNNGQITPHPVLRSTFDLGYRQGQAAQWRVSVAHPSGFALPANYFSPAVPGEVDNSYSCCANAQCPDTRYSGSHCNASPQRFPFPQDPPLTLLGYPGLNSALLPVNMSNRLQTLTQNAMNRNVTNLLPQATIISYSPLTLSLTVPYLQQLLNVSFTGVNPLPYQQGVWMPVLGPSPSATKNTITSLVCAYCGAGSPWNAPESNICNASNAPGGNTTSDETRGGTFAHKKWVLGMGMPCHQYTLLADSRQPEMIMPMHLSIVDVTLHVNAELRRPTATLGATKVTITCVDCTNIQDPYEASGSADKSAANNLIYCEPYDGFAATVMQLTYTNPWLSLSNPVTNAPLCDSCMPDELHRRAAEVGKYRLQWYFVTPTTDQYYISRQCSELNNAGNCRRNGFSDVVWLEDDCDNNEERIDEAYCQAGKGYRVFRDSNQVPNRCMVAGQQGDVPVGMQSRLCRDSTQQMCRPGFTSRSAGMIMEYVRATQRANVTSTVDSVWAMAADYLLPKTWERTRPNYWLGWLTNTSTGNLLYQYNRADAAKVQVRNTINLVIDVPATKVQPIIPISPLIITQSSLCLCVGAKTDISGSFTLRVPAGGAFPSQAAYKATLSIDGTGAQCIVNPNGATPPVSMPITMQAGLDTAVPVICTTGQKPPVANAGLQLTLTTTAQPQYVGEQQMLYLPCCASQSISIPPVSDDLQEALSCTIAYSTQPEPGSGTINFNNPSCGQNAFKPTPTPTPPPEEEPLPIVVVSSSTSPTFSGSGTPTRTASRTPTRTPTRTVSPTTSVSPSASTTPKAENNDSNGLDQGVMIGIGVAVGAVLLFIVAMIIVCICCANKTDKDAATKAKTE